MSKNNAYLEHIIGGQSVEGSHLISLIVGVVEAGLRPTGFQQAHKIIDIISLVILELKQAP